MKSLLLLRVQSVALVLVLLAGGVGGTSVMAQEEVVVNASDNGATATVTQSTWKGEPEDMIDRDPSTVWQVDGNPNDIIAIFELADTATVTKDSIDIGGTGGGRSVSEYEIYTRYQSSNSWSLATTVNASVNEDDDGGTEGHTFAESIEGTQFRLVITKHNAPSGCGTACDVPIAEYQLIGTFGTTATGDTTDTLYVDADAGGTNDGSSWEDAYVHLQDAFDAAAQDSSKDHQIWVAAGTYLPDQDAVDQDGDGATEHTEGDRTESFTIVNDNVELYGGFSGGESARSDRDPSTNEVVLSGDIGAASDTSDNSYNVLYVDGTTGPDITKNTTLDGVTVEKGVARGNFPNGDGGGLFCDAGGSGNRCAPVIENVVFRENVAVFGGAIFNNGTDIDAEKTATAKTSAVRSDGNRLHIDRREKSDASRGSRAASDGAHPKLTDVVFRDNKADGSGGAIYNWGDQGAAGPQISNSQFVGNVAESWGGAIMSDGSPGQSNPVIQNTTFEQNQAQTGGAVLFFAGIGGTVSPEVRGAVFSRNEAEYGGAVQIFSDSTDANGNSSEARPLFRDVTFSQNRATGATDDAGNPVSDGGALRTWAIDEAVAEPTVVNGIFTGNTATRDGGALHNVVATDVNGGVVQPTITNGTFAGNAADKNGGAVHNLGGDSGSASPVLSNVILWNNDGNADGDDLGADNEMFSANSSAQPAIRYSIIEGGAAAVEDVGDASTTYDESNLDQNPQFAAVNGGAGSDATYGTSDDDLRLQGPGSPNGASPAIDAGDNAALDLDGDGTIDVSQDVAAQDRRLDVEDVSDTGNGSPPIVDMGAHESDGSALRSGSPSPDAPSSLTAVSAADSVSLRWTSSDSADVAWYRVYRDTQPIDSTAGPSSYAAYDSTAAGDTTFTDINIQVDTAYYYRVTAIDTARNESGFSPGAQATPASQRSLAVTSLRPSSGAPGTTVRIRGVGFDPTPSNNTVTFGGTEATLDRATSTVLYARVPSGVSGPVEVSVSHEEMAARATGQFTVVTKGGDSFAVSRADLTGVSNASIAWGDYNSDGDLDLAVAGANASGNPTTKIYRNEGNGQFTAVGAGLTDVRNASVAWGDYDRDGDRDLAVAGEDANENPVTQIYRNEGNGQFTAVGAGLTDVSNASLAWGDYNNDGYLDLVVAGYGSTHTTKLYRNEGNGTFSTVGADLEGMSSGSTAWGDIDGDGDLDLVVVGQGETVPNVDPYGLEAKIYRNEGNGIFSTVGAGLTDVGEGSVAWGDYDGDGDLDLAFAGYERIGPTRFTRVYRNEGGGTFTVAGTDMMGVRNSSVHWGDVDGDGDLDLAVAGTDTTGEPSTTVYRNKGGEDFSPLGVGFPGVSSASVDWGDVDSDGDLDLAVAGSDGGSPSATIYENGTGEAAAPQSPTTLTATPAQGEVELSWNDVQALDLKSYRVYRDTEPFDTTEGPDAYSALTTVPAGQTTVTDSSPPSGTSVYYRVTAVDEDGNESSFSKGAVRYLDEMTADVRQVFGDPTEKENFELIGLPGRESVSLNTALPGRSPDDWRAFGWNGSFVEADASDDFEPGEGFWILAREAFSVDRSVEPVSLNEQGAYQIDLRNDWNLISNPFDVDVSWERIQRANGLDAALWQWDGRWKQVSTFTSAAEGTAFYVHNRANLDALSVPYPGLSTLGKNQAAQDKNTEDGSRLRLMAGRREQTNTMVQVLWNEGASEGIDTYDRFAPPGRFQPVRLRLQADSADIPLAVEARPAPSAEGRRYEMTLHAPAGTPVHVRVDRLSSFPAKNAVLVRRKTGEAFPLSGGSPVEITPRSASSQWVLLLGDQGYVEREMKALAPESVQLHPNYPNPVQQSTTFRYGLPDGQHVHLAIYDVLGRRVQVLVDGDQSAGIHTVRWQGRARGGERVASGVYFVRLRTDQQTKTRKMVVVR